MWKKPIEKSGKSGTMNATEMFKKKIEQRKGFAPITDKRFNELIIDAKNFIISSAQKYMVPRNEVELAEKELEYYKALLEEFNSGGDSQ